MDAPQVVRARMARQRLADDTDPLRFRGVIEQYVLDRVVGGPAVMRTQLEQLLSLTRRENVELHVMPVSATVHDGLDGDFLLHRRGDSGSSSRSSRRRDGRKWRLSPLGREGLGLSRECLSGSSGRSRAGR